MTPTASTRPLHNFNAGPSILPRPVLEAASQALLDFNGSGLSLLEIGHRTPLFGAVMEEAIALVRELMALDEHHEVLLLHGGASTQFFQVPMNLLPQGGHAAYTDTGIWAAKAIKEARLYGEVEVVCSSKEAVYNYLPKDFTVREGAAYLHLTTNNTIYGTQWPDLDLFYDRGVPLVADMSSDILSRAVDFNRFGLIYAGAQKNIGSAGVNLVVADRRLLGRTGRALPSMMDYMNHIEAGSLLNTPPVFAIYVCLLTLRWLKENGGIPEMEKRNEEKAALLYETLDRLPLFRPLVAREDRSRMNVTFVIDDAAAEAEFGQWCKDEGMIGIKGHRTSGGFRISLYNALPIESVRALTDGMEWFAQKKG